MNEETLNESVRERIGALIHKGKHPFDSPESAFIPACAPIEIVKMLNGKDGSLVGHVIVLK